MAQPPRQTAKYSMWALNTFFIFIIFVAIRQGNLYSIIPVSTVYIYLLNLWEQLYGTDYTVKSTLGCDSDCGPGLDNDTHSELAGTER